MPEESMNDLADRSLEELLARDTGEDPAADMQAPPDAAISEAPTGAAPAAPNMPADTSTEPGEGEESPAEKFAWLLERLQNADPSEVRSALEQSDAQMAQEAREAQLDAAMADTIMDLTAKLEAGEIDPAEAKSIFDRERRAVDLELRNSELQGQLATIQRRETLGKIRTEFPGAPAQILEHPALAGVDPNSLREIAGMMHSHAADAAKAGVSQYVAAKGQAPTFVPPTGQPSTPGGDIDLDNLTFEDIFGRK